ncbi:hypothetical protein PTI45_01802 [Paenibacillus nuruki]|uniref:DUF4309 domain-containing protein n=1 Tax=Paenibacillus nuruki TaxID=1886670 RepID=A0A1E3L4Z9_9BACL|nr:DUF4309 domain-containing protein [Paenibacillus nuruki]ODP28826.1 hypothetical protein PTI45_01802 [Paenibacillus nuruki]
MNRSTRKNNDNQQWSRLQISSGLWKISLLIVGLMIVAGCGNSQQQATPTTSGSTTPSDNNIVEPSVTASTPATAEPQSSEETIPEQSTQSEDTDDTDTFSGTTILKAAKEGTLPDLPKGLALGSSRETLFQLKGKPELGDTDVPMLSYGTFDVAFDGKDKIVELTSSADAYKKLKMDTIITELGKPDEKNDTSKDVAYTAEATYQMTNQDIPKYFLVFSYHTQTQKIQYVRLYEEIQ